MAAFWCAPVTTEAAVDVSRLAGLNPSGVICEVMNDDGTMARLPDLIKFGQKHGIKIGTISDLIAYRRKHDNLVKERSVKSVNSVHGGDWLMRVFTDDLQGADHVVLTKGDLTTADPVLVRVHALNPLEDVLGLGEGSDLAGGDADHRGRGAGRGGPAARHDDEDGRGRRAFAANPAAIRNWGRDPVGPGVEGDHPGHKLGSAKAGGT